MYVGDYYAVVEEITARVEREEKLNAQLEKSIRDRKAKVNFFANKGGKMRQLARILPEKKFAHLADGPGCFREKTARKICACGGQGD